MSVQTLPNDETALLLAELNHRVFNSFQIISALARRLRKTSDPHEIDVLLTALDNRLIASANLHRMLTLPMRADAVAESCRSLCEALVAAFGRGDRVVIEIEEGLLTPAQAQRFPLIVAELVTNALKHSLDGKPDGTIWIRLARFGEQIGLVAFDSHRKPIVNPPLAPSRFVEALATSLGGQAKVIDRGGYTTYVRLPLHDCRLKAIDRDNALPTLIDLRRDVHAGRADKVAGDLADQTVGDGIGHVGLDFDAVELQSAADQTALWSNVTQHLR